MVSSAARRRAVRHLRDRFALSERRASRLTGAHRSTVRYSSRRDDSALRSRLLELASQRPRFGYRRLHTLLCRDGFAVNHKRVYRLYRQEGLMVRRKKRKRVAQANRTPRQIASRVDEQWSMDFMSDSLASGRKYRTLNLVDEATRECLAIEVDTSLGGHRVVRLLDEVAEGRSLPRRILVDNGPEFTSRVLDQWAHRRGVELRFIAPGRPVENCFIESFNGSFRDECLNAHWFTRLNEARAVIEAWRLDYNKVRPHSSLGARTPSEYAAALHNRDRIAEPAPVAA